MGSLRLYFTLLLILVIFVYVASIGLVRLDFRN